MGLVKGKGKTSDPTPEATGAGGGNPPPPRQRKVAGAPGGGAAGDSDDDREESERMPDESRKGRWDERPMPQQEDDYDGENDEQFNLFFRVMANTLGQWTRVGAEPPALFKNEKYQDICMWLLTCTDYLAKELAVGKRGKTNPICTGQNRRKSCRTLCVNLPLTNDRRMMLY